jgi:glucose/mannose-6-phosphate isomerase
VLANCGLIPDKKGEVLQAAAKIAASLDEERAKTIARGLLNKVPLVYATDRNSSLAYLAKIKFNENSKTQSFWNYFSELNHNEMVGFTKMVMSPYFIIFRSQYAFPRDYKRIEIFTKLMQEKGAPVEIVDLKGDNVLEEILMGYYFIDHVTYYLADEYGIDPEPVKMVEDFKRELETD